MAKLGFGVPDFTQVFGLLLALGETGIGLGISHIPLLSYTLKNRLSWALACKFLLG